MNKIKEVYSRVTADESAVNAAIEKAKQQKITPLSPGRITAMAASFAAVVVAAGLMIFLLQTKNADMTSYTADAGAAEEVVLEEAPADEAAAGAAEEMADDNAKAGSQGGYSKSGGAVLYYHAEETPDLGVIEIRSGREDLTVTYHVSGDGPYDPSEISLNVYDADGNEAQPVAGEDDLAKDGGIFVTESFAPIDSNTLTLIYYDGGMLVKKEEITLTEE